MIKPLLRVAALLGASLALVCAADPKGKSPVKDDDAKQASRKVPNDLLSNDHVREEFGVNEFTTPSIRKIFDQLDSLGTLSYDNLKRPLPDKPPTDRVLIS